MPVAAGLAGALVVLVMLAPALLTGWVRAQLKKDGFRARMEALFGGRLDAEVTLAPLRWTGDEVTVAEAQARLANGWRAEMNGLHLGLDWAAFRQKTWRVIGAGADSLDLVFDPAQVRPGSASAEMSGDGGGKGPSIPAWLRSWLPDKTEVDGARVERFSMRHPAGWQVAGAHLKFSPWLQGDGSLQLTAESGVITTPLTLETLREPVKLRLDRAALRLAPAEAHLKEADLKWLDTAITARGRMRMEDKSWSLSANFERLPLAEVLAEDWRLRLTGHLTGEVELAASPGAQPRAKGRVTLKEGALTALPVLDRLAAYTNVERFKRLVLDVAETSLEGTAGAQVFDKIVLQSNGLMRLEGRLAVEGEKLDGSFLLGVTPETLRWMPGTQKHVFTLPNPNGPDGMVWTTLRITGTRSAPREDLSARILEGAGRAVLDAPGEVAAQAGELLLTPVLGKDAATAPGTVIKGATEAGGKAVESGVRLLEGIGGGLLKP